MQILQQQSKMNNSTVREVLKKTSNLSVRQNGSHADLSYNLEAEIEVICIPGGLKNVFFFQQGIRYKKDLSSEIGV